MSNVIIFLEGVLRKPHDKSPIQEGTAMYKSLADRIRTVIIADDKEEAERWFKQNGMMKKLDDIVDYAPKGEINLALRRVEYCRSIGSVEFVVTADLDLAKELLQAGITTYLFMQPKYMRPEFRPDGRQGRKSWENITEEIDRQQELYTEDPRL